MVVQENNIGIFIINFYSLKLKIIKIVEIEASKICNNAKVKKYWLVFHAIRLIKSYFTPTELRTLITSNFYSVLFYNAEIWLLPKLNKILKTNLLSSSANALKICTPYYDYTMSFNFLHTINFVIAYLILFSNFNVY